MIQTIIRIAQYTFLLGSIASFCYYMLCLWSVRTFRASNRNPDTGSPIPSLPPVSILKPLKGIDPEIYASFRSHCLQDYPAEYEIIFGVSDPNDPAVASVKQLQREFPRRSIKLVACPQILGANVKVSNLEQMLAQSRYEHILVNDSDIRVQSDYLARIMRPMLDAYVGMVTCLYRGIAAPTLGSSLESLGISTDFAAGVLVARQIEGGLHFGLGSTLAFRRKDLEKAGSFRSIVDYLADDYELGVRIARLGLQVVLSDVVVETHLPAYGWRGFFAHQMRWARGVRDARFGGYVGLASTFGIFWALLNLIFFGAAPWTWAVLAAMLMLRCAVALRVGRTVLKDRQVLLRLWLLPLRDLIAVGVWILSFFGHTVTWRGDRFRLEKGRLTRMPRSG
jgi:ceramide glucosyltransferase